MQKMWKKKNYVITLVVCLLLAGCSGKNSMVVPTDIPEPSATSTPEPTFTPIPTNTPTPTFTPIPTPEFVLPPSDVLQLVIGECFDIDALWVEYRHPDVSYDKIFALQILYNDEIITLYLAYINGEWVLIEQLYG